MEVPELVENSVQRQKEQIHRCREIQGVRGRSVDETPERTAKRS
jgi:hypothetical protein